jgi:hypothetical protein
LTCFIEVVETDVEFVFVVKSIVIGVWFDTPWCASSSVWQKIHEKWWLIFIQWLNKCRRYDVGYDKYLARSFHIWSSSRRSRNLEKEIRVKSKLFFNSLLNIWIFLMNIFGYIYIGSNAAVWILLV